MTRDKFTVVEDQLTGRGLSFDIATLNIKKGPLLGEIAETIYLQGRESVLPSIDDRFDLSCAVDALRALSVISGFPVSERHRRAADAIARLLQEERNL